MGGKETELATCVEKEIKCKACEKVFDKESKLKIKVCHLTQVECQTCADRFLRYIWKNVMK